MSYIKRWGDGWDFNNLQRAAGLKGTKPFLDHWGDSIGLGGFNAMGKAHGTNAMGGALIFGGSQALGSMGGVGGGSSMTGGLLDFSGGQAAAPIVDMSSPASASSLQGLNAGAGAGSGGMMSSFSQGLDVANKTSGLLGGFGGGNQQQQQQPMQHAQSNPQAFSVLMNPTDQVDSEKRRQAQQMAVQGLLGGYRG